MEDPEMTFEILVTWGRLANCSLSAPIQAESRG